MHITNDIRYIGVNDHKVDLFEGQYVVPNGIAYNSYVIIDEKITVMDTVDKNFTHEWLDQIAEVIGDRKPTYLVVQHMEPDHSANTLNFMNSYPEATIVSNKKAFKMMQSLLGMDFADRRVVVSEGSTLCCGKHILTFVTAPMVHWPEVMVTYDSTDKVLFSADGFGKFGALDENEEWPPEPAAISSASSASTTCRFRHCSRKPPRWISRVSACCTVLCSKKTSVIISACITHGLPIPPKPMAS